MTSIRGVAPIQDVTQGRSAFATDLQKHLGNRSIDEVGWAKPDDLTLLIPLFGTRPDGTKDFFLLRLYFDHYPTWPPGAQFVNPASQRYQYPQDVSWVPQNAGQPQIAFHSNYAGQGQVICCSLTLEFYKVNHQVEDDVIWQRDKHKFTSTIAAIKGALAPAYYLGRLDR
jgi:hypothetical protein